MDRRTLRNQPGDGLRLGCSEFRVPTLCPSYSMVGTMPPKWHRPRHRDWLACPPPMGPVRATTLAAAARAAGPRTLLGPEPGELGTGRLEPARAPKVSCPQPSSLYSLRWLRRVRRSLARKASKRPFTCQSPNRPRTLAGERSLLSSGSWSSWPSPCGHSGGAAGAAKATDICRGRDLGPVGSTDRTREDAGPQRGCPCHYPRRDQPGRLRGGSPRKSLGTRKRPSACDRAKSLRSHRVPPERCNSSGLH